MMTGFKEATRARRRNRLRTIGPWGTASRLVVGSAAVALAVDIGVSWFDAAMGLLVLPAALTLLLRLRGRAAPPLRLDGPEGPALLTMTWVVEVALGIVVPEALFLTLGASMLLGAALGHAGCEVTAIPNWLLRREDQIFCCLFTPIDTLESPEPDRNVVSCSTGTAPFDRGVEGAHTKLRRRRSRLRTTCGC